jgi:predicted dehydrogenase
MKRDILGFGVVGLGEFGEVYLNCIRSLEDIAGVKTTAVCSRSGDRAGELAQRFGATHRYTDAQELANDPDVDVVCVVTAEHDHFHPVMAALSAGKDVIVEKPLSTNLSEARTMIDMARGSGRQLLVGHLLRFETMYRRLHEQVRSGALGRPVSVHTRRNRPAGSVARYRRTHPILETGILDIDVMVWLTRSQVKRVTSVTRTVFPGPNPDLVWGTLEFADGCVGVLETSWLGPAQAGIFADDCISVIGTRGTARIDLSRAPLSSWNESGFALPDTVYSPIIGGEVFGAFREQMMAFVSALRWGQSAQHVPLDDVLQGLIVALALVKSSGEGRTVEINDFASN